MMQTSVVKHPVQWFYLAVEKFFPSKTSWTALIGDNSKNWNGSVDPFQLLRIHLQGNKIEFKRHFLHQKM